jgi:hypothetical protein
MISDGTLSNFQGMIQPTARDSATFLHIDVRKVSEFHNFSFKLQLSS